MRSEKPPFRKEETEETTEKEPTQEDKKETKKKEFEFPSYLPQDVKDQYRELIEKKMFSGPDLSPEETWHNVRETEKKHNYRLFGVRYTGESPGQRLVVEKSRLSVLSDLELATKKEKKKLKRIEKNFRIIIDGVVKKTEDNSEEVEQHVNELLRYGAAQNLSEAKEVLIKGPIIEGFDKTKDPGMPNDKIRSFLSDTFSRDILIKAKIGKVIKDDRYLIYIKNIIKSEKEKKIVKELLDKKTVKREAELGLDVLIVKNKESYLRIAMLFEGINNPEELEHKYKVRAAEGSPIGFGKIRLGSFGVENVSDFHYLDGAGLESEEDKMRAYILGTLAHEVVHRYEAQLRKSDPEKHKQLFKEYEIKMNESAVINERDKKGVKYVTDYVYKHKEIYGGDKKAILREDLAEAVRVYTTNPDHLKDNYPNRFEFIQNNFSFIKQGSVVESIREISE